MTRRPGSALMLNALLLLGAAGVAGGASDARAAEERVTTRAALHDDYARMVFDWAAPSGYRAEINGRLLTIRFDRPFAADLELIRRRLGGYVDAIRFGDDPATVLVALTRPITMTSFAKDGVVAIDLRAAPALPVEPRPATPDGAKSAEQDRVNPRAALNGPAPGSSPVPSAPAAPSATPAPAASPPVWPATAASATISRETMPASAVPSDTGPAERIAVSPASQPAPSRPAPAVSNAAPAPPAASRTDGRGPAAATPAPGAPAESAKAARPSPPKAEKLAAAPAKSEAGHPEPPGNAETQNPARQGAGKPAPAERPVSLTAVKRPTGAPRLILSGAPPFQYDVATSGREVTVTLSRGVSAPNGLAAAAALDPRIDQNRIVLALPEGLAVAPTLDRGRLYLDFGKIPGAAAAKDGAATAKGGAEGANAKPAARPAEGGASGASAAAALRELDRRLAEAAGSANPAASPASPPPASSQATPKADSAQVQGPEPTAASPAAAAPAPGPPSTVPRSVRAVALAEGTSLRFSPVPSAAAVFRRGNALWVAFDGSGKVDLSEAKDRAVKGAEAVPSPSGTILRFRLAGGVEPSLRRSETEWIVDLLPRLTRAQSPLVPRLESGPSRLRFDTDAATPPIILSDPEIGDKLAIVPLRRPGQGVATGQELVDLGILPSLQGIALALRSDTVEVASTPDGVEIRNGDGLLASADAARARPTSAKNRAFDFAAWKGEGDMLERRRALQDAVVSARPDERTWPRVNLARFFTANGYGAEARGVLEAVEREDPGAMRDPALRGLRGIVTLLSGNAEGAAADLLEPLISGDPDLELWRGALLAQRGDVGAAVKAFDAGMSVLPSYPKPLRHRLSLQAADARLAAGLDDAGLVAGVMADSPGPADRLAGLYLDGQVRKQKGDVDGAIKSWDEVIAGNDRASRARAILAKTDLMLDTGRMDRPAAIEALDALRFAWRGGAFEFELLSRIGRLRIADGDYRRGFANLREAMAEMPKNPKVAALANDIKTAFAGIFVGPEAASIPPLKALAIYDEYRDLMPEGAGGDAIIEKLADRLAAVDLLDRAAGLLDGQARNRLKGVERARVTTREALLRLLDRKPGAALEALALDVGKDLPEDLARQRQQMRARAMFELDHPAEALAAIAADPTPDAGKLRAEIAIRGQKWGDAARAIGQLAGDPPGDQPMDEDKARLVVNWAAALTLAGDRDGIAELRRNYEAAMAKTSLGDSFRIVAGKNTAGAADLRELTTRLAQVTDLQSFMTSYRKLVSGEKLSGIN